MVSKAIVLGLIALVTPPISPASQTPQAVYTSPDLLSRLELEANQPWSKNFSFIKHSKIRYSCGNLKHQRLWYGQFESKPAFYHSPLRLCAIGGGLRLPFFSGVIGNYAFLDSALIESQQGIRWTNLCNLNVGWEYLFHKTQRIGLNYYLPLSSYIHQPEEFSLEKSSHAVTQAYYFESGNHSIDGYLSQKVHVKRYVLELLLAGYFIFDTEKKLQIAHTFPLVRKPSYIYGITHKGRLHFSDYLSINYQLSYDNSNRPLHCAVGLHFNYLSYNPTQPTHLKFWDSSIERHLAPALSPAIVKTEQSPRDLNKIWLDRCAGSDLFTDSQFKKLEYIDQALKGNHKFLYAIALQSIREPNYARRQLGLVTHPDRLDKSEKAQFPQLFTEIETEILAHLPATFSYKLAINHVTTHPKPLGLLRY